ncbi:hypothetical protein [Anaerorhabdus sp.]|uniref:hypothetical protein n=1 Tax=Anaerorhabdus sp. TaxID=1872524 RepID=UPI002FC71FD2
MCKVGDIIVIKNYIGDDGCLIRQHSFIVINDEVGKIESISYDFVANVMSSFKDDDHKEKKLRFIENLLITQDDRNCSPENGKEAYIKVDQFYYFDKSKLDFYVIGTAEQKIIDRIFELIEILEEQDKLKNNVENLK